MIEIRQVLPSETWELRHKVMWPDKPIEFVKLENDAKGLHFGVFQNGSLVSVISLFVENSEAQFRKFATDKDFQGKGYGTKLLEYVVQQAKSLKISRLFCDARTSAIGFYERFGMKVVSDVFQKSGKDYVRMEIKLDE